MFPDILVPIVVFFGFNVLLSTMLSGVGLQRLVEGQKATGKELSHTAAYEAPFVSGGKS